MTVTIHTNVRNAMLNAVIVYIKGNSANTPYVDIRDAVPPPAVTAAATGNPMARIDFPAPPAAPLTPFPPLAGTASQSTFAAETNTLGGAPTYFRIMSGDTVPVTVLQGTVGDQQGDDLIFTNIVWQPGGTADITSMTLTVPVSCA